MNNKRIIARLDIKGDKLIKSIMLEGVQVIGDPNEYAQKYYQQGADEIIFMDAVASLYGRNHLSEIISKTAQDVFIPITVGGGLRSLADIDSALKSGADKIAINTAAVTEPSLITKAAQEYGSQCVVLQIDAKKQDNHWEVYTDGGREKTNLDVLAWAEQAADMGAGEILLTAIDKEGTAKGFDYQLVRAVTQAVSIPVIACGGMGSTEDAIKLFNDENADALAIAHLLHIEQKDIAQLKQELNTANIKVREQ